MNDAHHTFCQTTQEYTFKQLLDDRSHSRKTDMRTKSISNFNGVMILSSASSTRIEDVAAAAPHAVKWMQTYIFPNRQQVLNLIKRAEACGFKAIVVTVDSPISVPVSQAAGDVFRSNPKNVTTVNLISKDPKDLTDPSITFRDLAWLKKHTKLPVVAKGILTPDDAIQAAIHGASGVLVSNHGGRQLDSAPATIDVLPQICDALKKSLFPFVEVYIDGGIRNGFDIFKALALGARAVFLGRPIIWGLAAGGQNGVQKILEILTTELRQTMMLAGTPNLAAIKRDMVIKSDHCE